MYKPQTKSNEVLAKAMQLDEGRRYFLDCDFQWRSLEREIAPLKHVKREEWDFAMGVLYALAARFEEAEACFSNALRLSYDEAVIFNLLQAAMASGRFTRALELYREHGAPTRGNFTRLFRIGMECCCFETILAFRPIAEKMGLDVPDYGPIVEELSDLFNSLGVSEEDAARHMEAAGMICVKRRIKTQLKRTYTSGPDGAVMFSVLFVVPQSADEVFEMNIELAQAEEELGIKKHLAFDVAIVQSLESDEIEVAA